MRVVLLRSSFLLLVIAATAFADPRSSNPHLFLASGDKLFFVATTDTVDRELWVHDAAGTRRVRDINPGIAGSGVGGLRELRPGVILFSAYDAVTGRLQLWRTDGTEAGTEIVTRVNARASVDPIFVTFGVDGKRIFVVDDGVHGREPWVTDGTAEGTRLLAETTPGTTDPRFVAFQFQGKVWFFAGAGVWATDGTPEGTRLAVRTLYRWTIIAPTNEFFYFMGGDAETGVELWKSDGTPNGTRMVKDIRPGPASSIGTYSNGPTAFGSRVVFFANDGTGGRLWTSDGSAENTFALDAFPVTDLTWAEPIVYRQVSAGVFVLREDTWRTDGTVAGTYRAATGLVGGFFDAFSRVFYRSGNNLFSFDGRTPIANPRALLPGLKIVESEFTGGKIWLAVDDGIHGTELWVSEDGTPETTRPVSDIGVTPTSRKRGVRR